MMRALGILLLLYAVGLCHNGTSTCISEHVLVVWCNMVGAGVVNTTSIYEEK